MSGVVSRYCRAEELILARATGLSMQIPNRLKKRLSLDTVNPPNGASPACRPLDGGVEPPASFEDWLDGQLKTLYRTVVNEPLPPEILELLGRAGESK